MTEANINRLVGEALAHQDPEFLPLEPAVDKDGNKLPFATRDSIRASLIVSGVGELANFDARWGEKEGSLDELLAKCPRSHIEAMGRTGLGIQSPAAVMAFQERHG